jgi:hypothetical protein
MRINWGYFVCIPMVSYFILLFLLGLFGKSLLIFTPEKNIVMYEFIGVVLLHYIFYMFFCLTKRKE